MRRLGRHHDNYTFTDTASFKSQTGGRASSHSSRRICKALTRADKARERTTARLEHRNPATL
jgi:hypothetical protein